MAVTHQPERVVTRVAMQHSINWALVHFAGQPGGEGGALLSQRLGAERMGHGKERGGTKDRAFSPPLPHIPDASPDVQRGGRYPP